MTAERVFCAMMMKMCDDESDSHDESVQTMNARRLVVSLAKHILRAAPQITSFTLSITLASETCHHFRALYYIICLTLGFTLTSEAIFCLRMTHYLLYHVSCHSQITLHGVILNQMCFERDGYYMLCDVLQSRRQVMVVALCDATLRASMNCNCVC